MQEVKAEFEEIEYYKKVKINELTFILFHYPILEWDECHRGSFHLYGHTHERQNLHEGKAMNVGVDTRKDLTPWSLDEIIEKLQYKKLTPHH